MTESPNSLSETLLAAGYAREERGRDVVWSFQSDPDDAPIRAIIEVLERKSQFHLSKCRIHIELQSLAERIVTLAKKRLQRVPSSSFCVESDGRIRIVLEVAPPRSPEDANTTAILSKNKIGTVIGWTVALEIVDNALSVQMTDVFYIGDHVDHWFADITSSTTEAVAPGREKTWDLRHLREFTLPIPALAVSKPDSSRKIGKLGLKPMAEIAIPTSLRTSINGTKAAEKKLIETCSDKILAPHIIPIEIIEARETAHQWQNLDERITKRRVKNKSDNATLNADYLSRIAAAPGLIKAAEARGIESLIGPSVDMPLLAMTGASAIAREQTHSKTALDITALLLRGICERYGSINQLAPLRRIVPEYLGDCWSDVDTTMAFKSWTASITAGGNFQRVQFKIANLAKQKSDPKTELKAITALAPRERRRNIAAIIASRLIEIMENHPDFIAESSEDVETALLHLSSVCPENADLTLAISNRNLARGDIHIALSLLERRLSDTRLDTSGFHLAKLNALMAAIWQHHENKPTLAAQRFILATTPPSEPDDAILAAAETFFSQISNHEQKQRLTRLRIKDTNTAAGLEALERSAGYFADNDMIVEAASDIATLISSGRVRQWYLDIIEGIATTPGTAATAIPDALQQQIAAAMLAANLDDLPNHAVPIWQISAARIGIKFEATLHDALKILSQQSVMIRLSDDDAKLFYSKMIQLNQISLATEIVKMQLTRINPGDEDQLIDQIMKHTLRSHDGLFENAIAEFSAKKGDILLLFHRTKSLIAAELPELLHALCKSATSSLAGSTNLILFLDRFIEMIATSGSKNLSKPLETGIFERRTIGALTMGERASLYETLFKGEYLDLATEVLIDAIDHEEMICSDELIISDLLADRPHAKALWYVQTAKKINDETERSRRLQKSIEIWVSTDERPRELLESLIELGQFYALTDGDMAFLEQLVKAHGEHALFPSLISRQLDLRPARDAKDLIHWGLRFALAQLNDVELAYQLFSEWSLIHPGSRIEDAYTRAYLQMSCNQIGEAQKTLARTFADPEVLNEGELLLVALELLAKTKMERGQFSGIMQTLLVWAKTSGNDELTQHLKNLGIEWNVSGFDDLQREFINTFTSAPIDLLAKMAVQILSKAEKLPGGAQKVIADWMTSQVIGMQADKWWQLIKRLTTDRYIGQLKRSARCDVLYAYAMSLYDNEATRIESIVHLEAIASENPLDSRIWIPLYSLYEETASSQKLIKHLDKVIPMIQRDKSILDNTPLNLESLKNSLRRARRQDNAPRTRQDHQRPLEATGELRSKEDIEFMRRRTAAMQNEWLRILPVVKIAAIQTEHPADTHVEDTPVTQTKETGSHLKTIPTLEASSLKFQDTDITIPEETSTTTTPEPLADVQSHPPAQQQPDWRNFAINAIAPPGSTERIMNMAFASEIEKHIAIQSTALVTGEMQAIETWHWPVWRRVETFDYPLSPTSRMHDDLGLQFYHGSLHKLLRTLTPVLLKTYEHRLDISAKLARLGIRKNIKSAEVTAKHPAINRGALKFFEAFADDLKVRYFDTAGLGADVFFDIGSNAIHFDGVWQMGLPPGVLSYRAIEILNHILRGNIALASFDAGAEIMPLLDNLRSMLTATAMARVRVAFGMEHRDLSNFMAQVNRNEVIQLLSQNMRVTVSDITQLQQEIRLKSLATILASTLDLVGMTESLCGRDLCAPGALNAANLKDIHPLAKNLLVIASHLNL
jgi:hypothetical protein